MFELEMANVRVSKDEVIKMINKGAELLEEVCANFPEQSPEKLEDYTESLGLAIQQHGLAMSILTHEIRKAMRGM